MNEKLDICGRDELFFYYSWVVAQTLIISKKVRTRQSFSAHKLQKIRGNIATRPLKTKANHPNYNALNVPIT